MKFGHVAPGICSQTARHAHYNTRDGIKKNLKDAYFPSHLDSQNSEVLVLICS